VGGRNGDGERESDAMKEWDKVYIKVKERGVDEWYMCECVCVCVCGEENKDEKTTYPLAFTLMLYTRAISSPPSTFSGISLFIFLARIISLMYAKQQPVAKGTGGG